MLEFSRLRHTDRKPAIFIERIVIGKTVQAPGRELILPAGTHRVELHFDTIELASPEAIRLQYRLDDVDREWLDADLSFAAVYGGIPVGTHPFHVRACNADGVWDRIGIVYKITQQPYFYQTAWFRLSCVAAFLALLWGLHRLRVRQVAQQFNMRLEERVNERTRIARELHDTLLQSFQGLLLHLQGISNVLPKLPATEAQGRLNSVIDQAEQAVTEGRDAVQGLRSSTMLSGDFAAALNALGAELATADGNQSSPTFHVEVEGTPRELKPILRDEVYRIAGEALRNAFRHAQARRVEATIRYDEQRFTVRIRDDGKGISSEVLEAKGHTGHWGLQGMRERASKIGGELELWSRPDSGTEVQLKIPGAAAYGSGRTWREWLSPRRSSDIDIKT